MVHYRHYDTVYQAKPFPATATQNTIQAQSAPVESARATESSADVDGTIEALSGYRTCADALSVWRDGMADAYEKWRGRNAALVARTIPATRRGQAKRQGRHVSRRGKYTTGRAAVAVGVVRTKP